MGNRPGHQLSCAWGLPPPLISQATAPPRADYRRRHFFRVGGPPDRSRCAAREHVAQTVGVLGVRATMLAGGTVHFARFSPSGGVTNCAASFQTRTGTGSTGPQHASTHKAQGNLFFLVMTHFLTDSTLRRLIVRKTQTSTPSVKLQNNYVQLKKYNLQKNQVRGRDNFKWFQHEGQNYAVFAANFCSVVIADWSKRGRRGVRLWCRRWLSQSLQCPLTSQKQFFISCSFLFALLCRRHCPVPFHFLILQQPPCLL